MQPIATHLWFDTQAREAAEWYVSLFPNSRIKGATNLRDTPSGNVDVLTFDLAGSPFMAISAGPRFKFNPSISFHVRCGTAAEVDALWSKLADGGNPLMPLGSYPFNERYGWIADKYGVSWQLLVAGPNAGDQTIVPALMFTGPVAGKAEEAMGFYTSVFKAPPPTFVARYDANTPPDKEGTVAFALFALRDRAFSAMDSARMHDFTFNEAISIVLRCDTQEEIDFYWSQLSANPKAEQCGWLKDKYGVSWQVTPTALGTMLGSGDKEKTARVTKAFLQMKKFDIAALERAFAG